MIKINKDGIEISHNRYLTDTSTGLIAIINLLLLIKCNVISVDFLKAGFNKDLITIDLLLIIVMFFSITALGMLISLLSWLFLEYFYVKIAERIWWGSNMILSFLQFREAFDKMFSIKNYSTWQYDTVTIEETLILKGVNISRFQIQRGLRILIRNLSFIILFDSVLCFIQVNLKCGLLFLGISILSLLIAGAIGFYANLGLHFKAYLNDLNNLPTTPTTPSTPTPS